MSASGVIRLAIVNDYAVIVAGVATMLSDDRHRIQVTALDPFANDLGGNDVDVVLYDTFGPTHSSMDHLEEIARRTGAPVIVYTWKLRPDVAREAVERGAAGYLSKALTGPEIADAVEAAPALVGGDWPGRTSVDLSAREAEIPAMIAAGMSNREIADLSYLSINSVKTYIRTAYGKIGAERRAQAVRWALENGFGASPNTSAASEPQLR